MGDEAHCLLKEEISPLIRSSRASVRHELAKICGSVACVLSSNYHFNFCAASEDGNKKPLEFGYEVVCHACREGRC